MSLKATEYQTHVTIYEWLCIVLPDCKVFHIPNGGSRIAREAAKLKRMGVLPGAPDINIITKDGKSIFFEIKSEKGRLGKMQKEFRDFCTAAKIPYAEIRTIEEAKRALESFGVKMRGCKL